MDNNSLSHKLYSVDVRVAGLARPTFQTLVDVLDVLRLRASSAMADQSIAILLFLID